MNIIFSNEVGMKILVAIAMTNVRYIMPSAEKVRIMWHNEMAKSP